MQFLCMVIFFRQPRFCDWGFNLGRGEECLKKWNLIPDKTDILVTHGPPIGKYLYTHIIKQS